MSRMSRTPGDRPEAVGIVAERALYQAIEQSSGNEWAAELRQCLPVLINLSHEQPHTPTEALSSCVRRVVIENVDVDEGGDAQHHAQQAIESIVGVIVQQLEALRAAGSSNHSAGQAPPPLMCG